VARLLWDGGPRGRGGEAEFEPADYRQVLERFSQACGVPLEFQPDRGRGASTRPHFPVRMGGRRCGWGVSSAEDSEAARRAASAAAEVIGRIFTAEQDMASLAMELADRYEELNFLYEMGQRVGALLDEDEICDFVVNQAAWLMNCERASIMLADRESGELKIKAAVGLSDAVAEDVTVRPGERISGKVFQTGQGVIHNEGEPMPADTLNIRELSDARCFLSVPLKITDQASRKEQVLGVFNLTRKRQGSMFTASDLKLVSAVAAVTATQIYNCRLINLERERQQMEHELRLAARIQLSLLPERTLRAGPIEVAGHCELARHVGGDLFDYWLQDDRLCMVIADVSGHDIGAALMATAFRSTLRGQAAHRRSASGLMNMVNRALFPDLARAELLISAFYAEVDLRTGVLSFCRAGHPKPLLLQVGVKDWLDTEGTLLGVGREGYFEDRSVRLERGDTIVLYTDGLMEVRDPEGDTFGTQGIQDAALANLGAPPQEMAARIAASARDHSGGAPLADDMAVLVARFGGTAEG